MEIKSNLMVDTFNLIGIKQFDRKKESENKVKNRMKSYNNRGKDNMNKFNHVLNPKNDPQLNNIFTLSSIRSKQNNG